MASHAPMETARTLVRRPDGSRLAITEGGDPSGSPVFVQHGTPLSSRLYPPLVQLATKRGIRLIAYDRPGYGESDARPERTVADAARDVATIADVLDVPRFAVWGHSGGGPHALACAALLGDRVSAAAVSSSIAPHGAQGLDWLSGMGTGNLEEFRAALMGRNLLTRFVESQVEGMQDATKGILPELLSLMSPPDLEAMSGELGPYLESATMAGLVHGPAGWVDDDLAFVRPWGFEPDAVRVPVSVWHGKLDLFVPYTHSIWLAAHLPTSELNQFDYEGHLSLFERRAPAILDWLLAHERSTVPASPEGRPSIRENRRGGSAGVGPRPTSTPTRSGGARRR